MILYARQRNLKEIEVLFDNVKICDLLSYDIKKKGQHKYSDNNCNCLHLFDIFFAS